MKNPGCAQAMGGVFAVIGTPSCLPKPRGKSPGWKDKTLTVKTEV